MEARNAIVTGASYGIGEHIARALAARRVNLLLVARSEAELARLAAELRTRHTKVEFAAIDLGGPRAADEVARRRRPSWEPSTSSSTTPRSNCSAAFTPSTPTRSRPSFVST
jgi:short-subunit dehydrogenase